MFGFELLLGPVATTCLIGLATFLLIYWYSIKNHDYWKKRGVPFVKPLPFLGTMLEAFTIPIHLFEYERYFKHGPIFGHFEGSKPLLSVGDPALLRKIFVKDFPVFPTRREFITGDKMVDSMLSNLKGEEDWKRIRTILTPTFTTGKIKKMLSIFKDCSMALVQNFENASKKGKPVDVKRFFGAFTMDTIASSAFSTKIDSHNDPENEFVKTAKALASPSYNWKFFGFLVAPRLMKLLQFNVFSEEINKFFTTVTMQIIEERKRTGQVRNDFLQLLMDTAKEVSHEQKWDHLSEKEDIASNYGQEDINPHIFKNVTSKNLSMDELVAQCVIFFVAGYHTAAIALSCASYILALNPDIQDRLRAEVDGTIKEFNGELTYEAIQSMKYLDNVISETMRMYPPAVRLERTAESDYKLGDTGINIPKGMIVTVPIYAIQRDPKFFPDPEKFDPDRFTPEERAKRDQYVYLPFGAGPRNCIAMRFALMEVKTCLAHVVAHFNIKRCSTTKVPMDFDIGLGLLQPTGIHLEMETRKDCPLAK